MFVCFFGRAFGYKSDLSVTNFQADAEGTFFVTSVRGNDFAPQIAASASLSFFGAKMPFPAFFMAATFFLA